MSKESPYNVAQVYVKLAEAIRTGKPAHPGFEVAVQRHRMLDAIVRASKPGRSKRRKTRASAYRAVADICAEDGAEALHTAISVSDPKPSFREGLL
jgi:hypothetical protein